MLGAPPAPDRLAGRDRDAALGTGCPASGCYGAGLAAFALIPVGRDVAEQAIAGAAARGWGGRRGAVRAGGAGEHAAGHGRGAARGRGGSLLIGTVGPDVLSGRWPQLPGRRPA